MCLSVGGIFCRSLRAVSYTHLPVLVLIAACIFGMVYTGGFFEGVDFITAFADCSASVGLVIGSAIALMFTFVFYRVRGVMTFQICV